MIQETHMLCSLTSNAVLPVLAFSVYRKYYDAVVLQRFILSHCTTTTPSTIT
jgi:hypothetical protein